ncbi:aminopeptidase N [Nocardioides ginsengisegetis]|uniref:Aminopeptidase N n=1 Tax=Nocardioides ginsengisegetis TaxID=661491 RepID=A0A7W3IYW1_9ACTN|nr:aminopeptidase N [Nocardioides ginsengisegetis]MBA8803162.1 aminopeptidase N [Nocardioides ginsengisegetis]
MTEAGNVDAKSLTREEAEERGALLDVDRYDIAVDLRGLFEGEVLESVSRIAFRCTTPGASTFVDCAAEVRSATLNGRELDLSTVAEGRIPLPDLAADNVLLVHAAQSDTGSGAGILRTVDPSDKLVYVWTSFEPDDARRAWACFDQPDLKAPHAFTVSAPESWTVTSNGAPDSVEDLDDGGRVWRFPDTPRLSTYVVVVNAGPFHEIREQRGGHSLGLYCRQSLKQYLERDAADLLDTTERGLAFFGERFGQPFPQERYDQVFVPGMGGAMENWGCVTWTDSVLFRSAPTHGQKALVASVLLHEMAHMWFGDLVTMQWWDDLWLNEAFASWAATWASVNATQYTDGWATFLAASKLTGYQVDMGPASHPIRGDVPNVAQAMANFDAITYVKGESVLKQLVAYVGEDAFVEGLRAYFRDHAWGNTRLHDLMSAVGTAAGRDLSSWTTQWFDRAGTDTLAMRGREILATGPGGEDARPHHLEIGVYQRNGEALEKAGTAYVETTGPRTAVDGLPEADLYLLNDSDLAFAAVRPDERSLRVLLESAGQLPDPLSRAVAVSTAWDMLVKGELSTDELLTCVLDVLASERSAGVVEPFLAMALRAADQWSAPVAVPTALARLAAVAAELAEDPEHRAPALRTLAASATSEDHFALLDKAATEDNDLAWRVLARRAALGTYDAAEVEALLERDPDPEAAVRALGVTAARPDEAAKAEAWEAIFEKRSVPVGPMMVGVAQSFWRPVQGELMLPWTQRYLDWVSDVQTGGGMMTVGGTLRAMFPTTGDQEFLDRARKIATDEGVDPTVRATLLTGTDTLARVLRARG